MVASMVIPSISLSNRWNIHGGSHGGIEVILGSNAKRCQPPGLLARDGAPWRPKIYRPGL
ncbi:hypothetical protein TIFTF001_027364 [Ficus carica]|uniref:Uncharacterized protein n=1 Tax=Ficus carica TaxID=3494 RepID=A0AA88IYD8_FICCA|nr:hypothetical protein TIFTF001_027364 [Ficus carica]